MSEQAEKAWSKRNAQTATPRRPYLAGYADGAFDERLRLVAFIGEHQATLHAFAGEKGMDLLTWMLANLTPRSAVQDHPNGSDQ